MKGKPAKSEAKAAAPSIDPVLARRLEVWPIERVRPRERNPRTHSEAQLGQVARSIEQFGFVVPVLVSAAGELIAGHARREAAARLGLREIPVVVLEHLDDAGRRALVIADNRLAELAGWDEALLVEELRELQDGGFELSVTGFDTAELEAMERALRELAGVVETAATPPPRRRVRTKPGDLWECGRHWIACGDTRDQALVRKLLGDARVDLAFTSPPYAAQRDYDPASGFEPVPPDGYVAWFEGVQASVREVLKSTGSWLVNVKEHCADGQRHPYVKELVIAHVREWGWRWVEEFAWVHGGTPRRVDGRFKNGFEPVYAFAPDEQIDEDPERYEQVHQFTRAAGHKFRPKALQHRSDQQVGVWGGGHPSDKRTQGRATLPAAPFSKGAGWAYPSNVVRVGKNRESNGHAAAFPPELPAWFVLAFTDPGDVVFDPFLGSGSTLVACERLGRLCYGVEISPQYVEAAVERWERTSNQRAVHHAGPRTPSAPAPRGSSKRTRRKA